MIYMLIYYILDQPREVLPKTASVHSCSEINFNLTFEQIFPVPVCSGTYGVRNVSEKFGSVTYKQIRLCFS